MCEYTAVCLMLATVKTVKTLYLEKINKYNLNRITFNYKNF